MSFFSLLLSNNRNMDLYLTLATRDDMWQMNRIKNQLNKKCSRGIQKIKEIWQFTLDSPTISYQLTTYPLHAGKNHHVLHMQVFNFLPKISPRDNVSHPSIDNRKMHLCEVSWNCSQLLSNALWWSKFATTPNNAMNILTCTKHADNKQNSTNNKMKITQ